MAGHGVVQLFVRQRGDGDRAPTCFRFGAHLALLVFLLVLVFNVFPRKLGDVSSHYGDFA